MMMKRLCLISAVLFLFSLGASAQLKELGFQKSLTWEKMNAVPAPLKQIGTVDVVRPDGKGNSLWSVGCETIERGFTVYDEYKQFVGKLGVGYARLMSGWAKTETQKGVYDFEWLDAIVDDMIAQGVCPWMCICYANPIYKGLIDLDSPIWTDEETMQAWLSYVKELVVRYKGKITMYEIWNEPNGGNGSKYPESYVNLFIRTAELIRELDPDVKIAGLALAGSTRPEYVEAVMSSIAARGKSHLMDYATFHPYAFNPDETVRDIENFRTQIKNYAPDTEILQGENGTNATLQHAFALGNYEWTEYSQAKWYMRRMSTDFRLGIPSSVFTMVDIKYNHTVNNKGLIKTDLRGRVIWVRPAFHAVSHYASILTPEYSADNTLKATSDVVLDVIGLVKDGRKVGAMVWINGSIPNDEIVQTEHDVVIEGLHLKDPVWVEPITGRVCELDSFKNTSKGLVLKKLPVWDSQIFIIERDEVILAPVPDYSSLTAENHPRLLYTDFDFDRLKKMVKSGKHTDVCMLHDQAVKTADDALSARSRLTFKKDASGKRILTVSRNALARIVPCAYAYKLTGDVRYLHQAEQDILDVCSFKNWNPGHYLDVAEMATGVSLAYDWLYDDLKASTKVEVVRALHDYALQTSRNDKYTWWYDRIGNWNQVCNAGLVCSALAIYEHCPDLAQAVIDDAVKSNRLAVDGIYGPDGAYPEGPTYWSFGTLYQVLMLALLENAVGTDFNLSKAPGFLETGTYKIFSIGTTGKHFNFADNMEAGTVSYPLWYFAAKNQDPSMMFAEREALKSPAYSKGAHRGLTPFCIRNAMELPSGEYGCPAERFYSAQGNTPLMMCRSGWGKEDHYLGIKGGQDAYLHGHMDGGSFVYDAYGVRWAADMNRLNYALVEVEMKKIGGKLSDYSQDSFRWKLFRLNCRQHNTLTVNDKDHNVAAFVKMTAVENSKERMAASFDLTPLFDGDLIKAERTAAICGGSYLEIRDKLATPSDRPAKVRWTIVTEGKPEVTSDGIVLEKNGVRMLLRTEGAEVNYKVWSSDPKDYDNLLNHVEPQVSGVYICGYETDIAPSAEVALVTSLRRIR